jgi:peptidoglycan/LPS O-acetylase OafA/YrhL
MRLFLAGLVMLSHGSFLLPSIDALLPRGLVYGPVAVFVFFVISGVVITEAVLNFYDGKPVRFFLNRLLRLYPPYVMALVAAYMVLSSVPKLQFPELPLEWTGRENLFANLFSILPTVFLTDWILGVESRVDLIGINWALRVEFAFYIVVAAVVLFSRYLPPIGVSRSVGLRFVFVTFLCVHGYFFYLSESDGRGAFYSSFIPYFLMGVAWAFRLNSSEPNHWRTLFITAFVLSVVQAAMYPVRNVGHNDGTPMFELVNLASAVLWLALIGVLVALSHLRLTSSPVRKFDAWLGDLSYPVYVMHMPALYVVANQMSGSGLAQLGAFAGLTFSLSWISAAVYSMIFDRLRDVFRGAALRRA